jgi:head-tail adaptor
VKKLRTVDLRHRVNIRRSAEVKTVSGGLEDQWSDVASVYAEVEGLNGRESLREHVLRGISFYQVRIRWREGLLPKDELSSAGSCFGGKPVNIRSIADPDGKREQLVILADTADALSG